VAPGLSRRATTPHPPPVQSGRDGTCRFCNGLKQVTRHRMVRRSRSGLGSCLEPDRTFLANRRRSSGACRRECPATPSSAGAPAPRSPQSSRSGRAGSVVPTTSNGQNGPRHLLQRSDRKASHRVSSPHARRRFGPIRCSFSEHVRSLTRCDETSPIQDATDFTVYRRKKDRARVIRLGFSIIKRHQSWTRMLTRFLHNRHRRQ
jgi:hypothetical protein